MYNRLKTKNKNIIWNTFWNKNNIYKKYFCSHWDIFIEELSYVSAAGDLSKPSEEGKIKIK